MSHTIKTHAKNGLKWGGGSGVVGLVLYLVGQVGDLREDVGGLVSLPKDLKRTQTELAATRLELAQLRPLVDRNQADLGDLLALLRRAPLGLDGRPDFRALVEQQSNPPAAPVKGGG